MIWAYTNVSYHRTEKKWLLTYHKLYKKAPLPLIIKNTNKIQMNPNCTRYQHHITIKLKVVKINIQKHKGSNTLAWITIIYGIHKQLNEQQHHLWIMYRSHYIDTHKEANTNTEIPNNTLKAERFIHIYIWS